MNLCLEAHAAGKLKKVEKTDKVSDKDQKFTGNENPNNARVILLNQAGEIILVMSSSILLSKVCRLSNRDFFAGRTSGWEMCFLISTIFCLFLQGSFFDRFHPEKF